MQIIYSKFNVNYYQKRIKQLTSGGNYKGKWMKEFSSFAENDRGERVYPGYDVMRDSERVYGTVRESFAIYLVA